MTQVGYTQASLLAERTDRALSAFAHGDEDGSYPMLRSLALKAPPSPWVFIFAGAYERKHGNTESALKTFTAGTKHFPDNATLYTELAVTQSWLGDLEGARNSYLRALELDPGNHQTSLSLARVQAWLGEYDKSAARLRALASVPGFKTPVQLVSAMLATLRLDIEKAETLYGGILAREPGNPEAERGLAQAQATTRFHIGANAGAMVTESQVQSTFHAHGSYRLSSTLEAKVRYQLDGLNIYSDPQSGIGATQSQVHRIGAAATWKATTAVKGSAGYELQLRQGARTHVAELGVSVSLMPTWTILVGTRTFFGPSPGLLANTGIVWAHSENAFVLLQGFHFNDMKQSGGTIGVLTVQQPVNESWIPKASLGIGTHSTIGTQATVSAELSFLGWDYADLGLSYEHFAANFRTHRVRFKVERRF